MQPQVVNFKNIHPCWGRYSDVYIGRAMPRFHLIESPFANPFKIDSRMNRRMSLLRYEDFIRRRLKEDPGLLEALKELSNAQRLVCWCKPDACHGDILVTLMKEYGFI